MPAKVLQFKAKKALQFTSLWLAAAAPSAAAHLVTLSTGFQIRAEKIELLESTALLTTGGGALEIPRAKIATIEDVADAAPAEAVPASLPVIAPQPAPIAVAPTPAPPKNAEQLIQEAADRYGLPSALVRSVAKAESNIRQDAISPKGAIGVMQLMPETAARLLADPNDLAQNVDAGARYLRELLLRYDGSAHKALAAYNAGEKAVDRYQGIPPYAETQTYVRRVLWQYLKNTGQLTD